jgi:tellurite resistance protein
MGLMGLSLAWGLAARRFGAPRWVGLAIGDLAVLALLANGAGYALKLITAPDAVRAEFLHPVTGSLFGTVLISLLLTPIALAPVDLLLARGIWVVGAAGMIMFAWLIVGRWMNDLQLTTHATPAWIVPVVGLLDMPVAMPALGINGMAGMAVLCLSVGLFFALPLFTMIFSRLLFEPPMPDTQVASLLILLAPFSAGFAAYVAVTGRVDLFAEALYMIMLFLLAVLCPRVSRLAVASRFSLSFWTISFPLASAAAAALRFSIARPAWASDTVALALLFVASGAIAWLTARTLLGLARGELRTLIS